MAGEGVSWRNWSGSVEAEVQAIVRPADEEQLRETIQQAPSPLRLVGSGHSFTPLVATSGTVVDLAAFSGLIGHDDVQTTATVGAGTKLGQLTELLAGLGQALPNMGDIDKQTVGGALATATHGSGLGLGAYHTQLRMMRFLDGRGAEREFLVDRDQEMIEATGVTLGVFGALTAVTFQNVPRYNLRRKRSMQPLGQVLDNFETLMAVHRSAEVFFVPFARHALIQTLDMTEESGDFHMTSEDEAGLATLKMLRTYLKWLPSLRRLLIGNAMAKLSDEEVVGEWMKIYVSDRQTKFNEMEYHLPFEEGSGALTEIITLIEKHFPQVYFPVEVRSVQADKFWLSPFYSRDTCSIAVHHDAAEDPTAFFRAAEAIFRRRGGRPHWGKMHNLTASDLAASYPRFRDAMEVRRDLDPDNRFISPYMARLLGIAP
ncbi:D-arabinono-1,4-lactone oxidase [Rhizobium wuzhouense]|uniref:Oxidoreductase n=1 Tax=Rhizobium wuzhouense TaxID=1986026 RepID=A0ABX5NK32_9HYPH|nr:D-arabinono-1,4-lactone oxidase [Rhizobium wuzhouense]PYB69812.1 oxidoreductase [Rhizobium wuzhouense]